MVLIIDIQMEGYMEEKSKQEVVFECSMAKEPGLFSCDTGTYSKRRTHLSPSIISLISLLFFILCISEWISFVDLKPAMNNRDSSKSMHRSALMMWLELRNAR